MYELQQPRYKRASATAEELAARRSGSRVPTHTQNTEEDRSVSVTSRSAIRHRPIGNMYVIPLTDGSEMRVTERELDTLPENYQNAAKLIMPQVAVPRQRRQPNSKRPVQDDTVYPMPPAQIRNLEQLGEEKPYSPTTGQRIKSFLGIVFIVLGISFVLMIVGWIALSALGNWLQVQQDDWHYGRPRTFQTDCNVGHGTTQNPMSHFIALNLNKHIEVIEFPGDDPTHAKIYIGPTLIGQGQELTPVTLSFEDVNNDGRPDLVIHVGDSKFIFLNQKDGTFKAAPNQ